MINFSRDRLDQISRREFIQLGSAGLFASLLIGLGSPYQSATAMPPTELNLPCRGRVLEQSVKVFSAPDFRSTELESLGKDDLVDIELVTLGEESSQSNRIWYGLPDKQGYLHSTSVQPVETRINPIERYISGKGYPVEVTVPFTDTVWNHRLPDQKANRLYYGTVVWVTAVAIDNNHRPWYYLSDEWTSTVTYFGQPEHFHILTEEELAPISNGIEPNLKRIEVRLQEQVMVAYEGERPVFMSRVSTGTAFGTQTFYTPPGLYYTNGKFPSRHMTHPDRLDVNAYDLPGVPWACYITSNGIAFHGTYWHNDFGRKRSHGCINLNLAAAKWVYRWTAPSAPLQERMWLSSAATRVEVIA